MSEKKKIEEENQSDKVEQSTKFSKSSKLLGALTSILVAVVAFLSAKQWKTCESPHQPSYLPCMPNSWNMSDINVLTMRTVFDRLGYKRVNGQESWDVIWSIGFSSIFEELPNVVK